MQGQSQPRTRGLDALSSEPEPGRWHPAYGVVGWLLLALAIGALLTFFQTPDAETRTGKSLPIRALQIDAPAGQFDEVAPMLMNARERPGVSSDLTNHPFWIRSSVEASLKGSERLVHLPSVGIGRADFVVRDQSGNVLAKGNAGRYAQMSGAERAQPGFSIAVPDGLELGRIEILMRIEPLTLTRIGLELWDAGAFKTAQLATVQRNVLVLGALLFLAIYAFTAAAASARYEFTLLGAWLMARCAMLVMDTGLGATGLKTVEPLFASAAIEQWLTVSLPFTTLLLARVMLAGTIATSRFRPLMTPLTYGFAALFGVSAFLPVWAFQSVYWLLGGLLMIALFGFSVSAWRRGTDHAGRWFALGALCDGVGALFALLQDIGIASSAANNWFANDQMSMAAAVLAGLAVGQRLNLEREQRVLSQRAALATLEKYQAVYRSVPTALVSVADGGRVVRYNEGFARLFGLENHDDLLATRVSALEGSALDQAFPPELRARIRKELRSKVECDFDLLLSRDSGDRWLRIMARGSADAYEASLTDISEQKAIERHLERVAEHDPLTGALNRLGLSKHLQTLLSTRDPDEIGLTAICYVDLDRFKMLNDLFGHNAGDSVLCEVVNRLQNSLGHHNVVARLGGDEFVIVLGAADQSVQEGLAWRALDAITGQAFQFDGKSFAVTASIGVFRLVPGLGQADLIASADRACQDAKRRGRNQVVICEDSNALVRRRQWELELVARLNDPRTFEEFELVAQPIVTLHGSERVGCELLLRHRDENHDLSPAASLISAAEANGEMAALDRWVLTQALDWLQANREHLDRLEFLSVNLSGSSLNDEFFKAFALAQLGRNREVAEWLVLEIAETVATQDIYMTSQFAQSARAHGARLSLDDFGGGYSNLSSLATMPASFLKIDGRFVNSLRSDGNDLHIVRTISLLAHELQMACVAEWVEDTESLRMLRAVGVDFAQGHAVSRPVTLDVLIASLDEPGSMISTEVRAELARPVAADFDGVAELARKITSVPGAALATDDPVAPADPGPSRSVEVPGPAPAPEGQADDFLAL